MAVLLENVTNCVWLAFAALQQDKSGLVQKSKLKVLTANIATLLDLYGVEKGLEHFKSTPALNFNHFKYYLQREVFASLPDKLPLAELRDYEAKIAEICWLVCRKHYLACHQFNEENVFQLFRIFCLLAELIQDENDANTYVLLLNSSEALSIAQQLAQLLGNKLDEEDFQHLCVSITAFRLAPFLATLETRCLDCVKDVNAINEAVRCLHQTFVDDVIKKGVLAKKGYIFPTMKEYFFVLRPSELSYYKTSSEKDKCGVIALQSTNRLEPKVDYKFALYTVERSFEFGANDHITRLQWISALQTAIEHSGGAQTYQRLQASKRRLQRQGRLQDMLRTKAQLQAERSARQVAEVQAKELEVVVREEAKRFNELQQIRERLEKLLEEETQAKQDEEIVRALQARVLAEEWEKREELERLQEEQTSLLQEEIEKRREYERLQRLKETQLKEAEAKLAALENERKILDDELSQAHKKIKISENMKVMLEKKLQTVTVVNKDADKIRRTHSFMPSTKEKPTIIEMRSATLRKSPK